MNLQEDFDFDSSAWRRENDPNYFIDEALEVLAWVNGDGWDAGLDDLKLEALADFMDAHAEVRAAGERLLAVFKDLTDRRLLKKRLNAATAEQERARWN